MPISRKPVPEPTDLPAAEFPSLTAANPAAYEQVQTAIARHRRIFHFLAADLSEHVAGRLAELGRNARWLAQKLGKQDSEISRWLSGEHNLTLESIAKLSDALEEDLLVSPRFPLGFFGQPAAGAEPAAAFTATDVVDLRGGSYNADTAAATSPAADLKQPLHTLTATVQTTTGEEQRYYSFSFAA